MFTVVADTAILAKLAEIMQDEPKGTCIRLKEFVVGSG